MAVVGRGKCHTTELGQCLARAGFEVKHIFARYKRWSIGNINGEAPLPSEVLAFEDADWQVAEIQARYRRALADFKPDVVLVTDAWNFKPQLAEAAQGYPYILRFDAMECLCPLNNIRMLCDDDGFIQQCPRHQLATPQVCAECVGQYQHTVGKRHNEERLLAEVGTDGYYRRLLESLRGAEAVLAVNPLVRTMLEPFGSRTVVVTPGVEARQFSPEYRRRPGGSVKQILFAGIATELLKGFSVLKAACGVLWEKRRDFVVRVTANSPRPVDLFLQFIGYLSRDELHAEMEQVDLVVMPSLCQDACPITCIEAMAAGCPVVASRLGGLGFLVVDDLTGLLVKPGDPEDLAEKIGALVDSRERREEMGRAARKRFETHFSWDVVVERDYLPLLSGIIGAKRGASSPTAG